MLAVLATLMAYLQVGMNVKAQVVTGLGGSLLGAVYALSYLYRNRPIIGSLLSVIVLAMIWFIYGAVERVFSYNLVDTIIFMLATNARPLKSITAYAESVRTNSPNRAKQEMGKNMPAIRSSYWRVVDKLSFEQSLEEMICRMILMAGLVLLGQSCGLGFDTPWFRPVMSWTTLSLLIGKVSLFVLFSYGCRWIESELTGGHRPGAMNRDMTQFWQKLLYMVIISKMACKTIK
ncbi:hypothetical protein NEHOM01_1313 [Nematocida homosporus]|uniref:uncharacterized protein n=1 Tax=Nematocida homosporus TaxID=1912981 RepID=UPI00221F6629|nr:uncharacterized protein NEHOM01_1313 [Nematocida homosporus]KAI5186148.1 hypothetical protein NEHOM01_1313 [Nematocida homosporus]